MADFIRDARELVDMIPVQFHQDYHALVTGDPDKIMEIFGKIALWAETMSGDSCLVNMRMPGIKRTLERLADQGPGHSAGLDGVMCRFVSRKFLSSSPS